MDVPRAAPEVSQGYGGIPEDDCARYGEWKTRAGELTSEEASHEEYKYLFHLVDILYRDIREKMRHSVASAGGRTRRRARPFYLDESTYLLLGESYLSVFR